MTKVYIPLRKYKAAIFDMDGTMVNNMQHHKVAWMEFLQKHGIELSEDEFSKKVSGRKNDQIFEVLFGDKLTPQDKEAFAEEKEALYRKLYKADVEEIEGLSSIVDQLLKNGVRTAIATSATDKNREFVLTELGLSGKFEVIVGDEHVKHGKPHPEIYLETAARLEVSPQECLVFEDSPPGVEAAKTAGMDVVAILSSHSDNELKAADYLAEHFNQIQLI